MSMVLVFICLWSLLFSIYHLGESFKQLYRGEFKKFIQNLGKFVPFAIVWIDAFLRIFSVSNTGLW